MRKRLYWKLRPTPEPCESKQLMSGAVVSVDATNTIIGPFAQRILERSREADASRSLADRMAQARRERIAAIRAGNPTGIVNPPSAVPSLMRTGITMERITNPTPVNTRIIPPLQQVAVQDRQPVPGQSYNVVFITLRNSTGRTFDASDGFEARITGQGPGESVPVLSGTEDWKPGEVLVFYFLTKDYYPLRPIQSAGFEFNFVNPRVVAIPGPSGFFQRITYIPETFPQVLDTIVTTGPGSKGRAARFTRYRALGNHSFEPQRDPALMTVSVSPQIQLAWRRTFRPIPMILVIRISRQPL